MMVGQLPAERLLNFAVNLIQSGFTDELEKIQKRVQKEAREFIVWMSNRDGDWEVFCSVFRVLITVLITWIFFRANDIDEAFKYLANMFGLADVWRGAPLVGAIFYSRYHLLIMIICAIIVWFSKQSWDIARSDVNLPKMVALIALFILTLITLFTQTFNPFLYFQF